MGEFEKRIKGKSWRMNNWEDMVRDEIVRTASVKDILEEAKKEFPECYEISSTRIYDVHEIKEWLDRWFGSDKEG